MNIAKGIFLTIVISVCPYFEFSHFFILSTSSAVILDLMSSVVFSLGSPFIFEGIKYIH